MPTYRVGVLLTASGGSFQRGMRAAAGTTRQTQSALQRASGSATAFAHRTDEAGRRAQSALQRASGSVRGLQSALQRTSSQARQTGSAIDAAAGQSNRRVRGLIQSFRDLGRAIRESGAGAGGGAGGGIGGGAIARAAGVFGGGYALSRAAGQELSLDERFMRLAVDAGKSDAEALQIRRHIEAVAMRDDIRAPVEQVLAAVTEYVDRTGDLDQAITNLETTAQTIQRTGAEGIDIGRIGAQVRKLDLRSNEDYRQAMIDMIESERSGALKGRDFARHSSEALSLYTAIPGMQGLEAFRDFLVMSQMGMVATADPAKTFTAMRSVMAASQDEAKLREMEKLGVFGAATRSPLDVMNELIAATNGDLVKLGRIFEMEARAIPAAFTTAEGQNVQRGVTEDLRSANEELFEEEVARLADLLSSKTQAIRDRMQSLFSRFLGGPMEDIAAAAFGLQDVIIGAGIAGATTYGAYRAGRRGLDTWRGWRGRGGDEAKPGAPRGRRGSGGGIGGSGLVRTMHVTTLIAGRTVGGGLGGAAGRGRGATTRAGGGGGFLRRAGGLVSRAGGRAGLVGVALGSAGVATALAHGDKRSALEQAGGVAGGLGGGAIGAAIGAAIGTAIAPGIGTAVLGGLGSFVGGWFGSKFGAEETASALERAAGMDAETRDSRRRAARRRWQAEADGRDVDAGEAQPSLGRDELRRRMREGFNARGGQVVNGGIDRSVHIDGGITVSVHSETGDPAEIGEAAADQIVERVRRELRHDQERIVDLTLSDPDPTLLF